jgi:hypothetical protein
VRAAGVNPLDWFGVTAAGVGRLFYGVRRPRIRARGVDAAGVVEALLTSSSRGSRNCS